MCYSEASLELLVLWFELECEMQALLDEDQHFPQAA